MRLKLLASAALALGAAVTPVHAALVVTTNLGTVASGTIALSGTTVGQANNAFVYTSTSNTGTTLWGNGEYVYQFTLTKSAYLYLTNTAEPDADGTFPDPNHDYFLLNTLTTFNSDNTATNPNPNFPNFTGKPEGTSLALVQETVGPTTAGSSANIGIFRSAASNAAGIWAPGTYYVSVDSRSGTLASFGQSNQLPAGRFAANLNVKYLDEVTPPTAVPTTTTASGQITGTYTPGQVVWTSFVYDGSALTLNTQGNTLNESGGDTFLALYDSAGTLVKFNDDVLPFAWSQLSIAAGELVTGSTYYLGLTEYKGVSNSAFDLSVQSASVGATGNWVINGLAVIPTPTPLKGDFGGNESPNGSFNTPDQAFNEFDLEGFLLAFSSPSAWLALNPTYTLADLDFIGDYGGNESTNGSFNTPDGVFNEFDLEGFLLAFGSQAAYDAIQPPPTGPSLSLQAIPEPSALTLLTLAVPAVLRRRRR